MKDFVIAALPWLAFGLSIALIVVLLVRYRKSKGSADKPADSTESDTEPSAAKSMQDYGTTGLFFGMILGAVAGWAFSGTFGGVALTYGLLFGMVFGLVVGMCFKRK